MDTNILFKYRSVTSCMKAAYDLMSNHIVSIIKKTWWAVLPCALLMAITTYFRLPNKALHDWGISNPWSSYILQTVIYLLMLVSTITAGTSIWTWVNNRTFKKNFLPFLFINLSMCILVFVLGGACSFVKGIWSLPILLLAVIVLLPYAYATPYIMLLKPGEKPKFWNAYKMGLRHLGGFFLLGFLCGIIICLISSIIALPALILGGAQLMAQLGALEGDALGVPGYFTPLLLLILTITCFLVFYLSVWSNLASIYLYASYEVQEIEKKKQREANMISQVNTK